MTRSCFICDWHAPDGTIVGVTLRDGHSLAASYVMHDVRNDDPRFLARLTAIVDRCRQNGDQVRDLRTGPSLEWVTLHDGPEVQHLAPGVAPVPLTVRQLAQEAARRAGRRGDAPLPSGGLFDDVARAQGDLFA